MTGFDEDAPMSLDEAAKVLLRGAVTASTLRAAISRRELACERIGRRIVVTPADIRAWRERCRIPAEDRPTSASFRERTGTAPLSPAHIEAARAACRATIARVAEMKPRVEPRRLGAKLRKVTPPKE